MNYLAYLLLALLLTCFFGPSGTVPVSERVQKLFSIMKSHVAACPKEEGGLSFYECPSHVWPDIVQNFIPLVSSLGTWIKRRIGVGDVFWYYLVNYLKDQIVRYDPQELGKIRDEVIVWTLLSHYLEFRGDRIDTFKCLAPTLNAVTDLELAQVSRLPYHGNNDLFEEINELVNDPRKARLLDGLKRASRDDFEMGHMIVSLRRWLKRAQGDREARAIFHAASDIDMRSIPIEQLNAETMSVPNFQGDPELAGVFGVIFSFSLFSQLDTNRSFLQDSLPQSLPGRDHIISVLTRLGDGTRNARGCRGTMEYALRSYQSPKHWDEVLSYNVCMMKGLSKIPGEFFEEHEKLDEDERLVLSEILGDANLPSIYVLV